MHTSAQPASRNLLILLFVGCHGLCAKGIRPRKRMYLVHALHGCRGEGC
jgi:hypothetical protein